MKIFISWSGELSSNIVPILKKYIKGIFQSADIFFSSQDIKKGEKWIVRLSDELKAGNYGIICLTSENMYSPWLNFEAGALSQALSSRVSPFLIDVQPCDVTGPLAAFQATRFLKEDFFLLIHDINSHCETPLTETLLRELFEETWSAFDTCIKIKVNEFSSKQKKRNNQISPKFIEQLLCSACESLIFPHKDARIRAVILKLDYLNKKRYTVYSYNARPDPEKTAELPLLFGVVGECIKRKMPVIEELPMNHIETYDSDVQSKITKELRGVIAAPIFDSDSHNDISFVLAFDILKIPNVEFTFFQMNFDRRTLLDIAQSWAEIFSLFL